MSIPLEKRLHEVLRVEDLRRDRMVGAILRRLVEKAPKTSRRLLGLSRRITLAAAAASALIVVVLVVRETGRKPDAPGPHSLRSGGTLLFERRDSMDHDAAGDDAQGLAHLFLHCDAAIAARVKSVGPKTVEVTDIDLLHGELDALGEIDASEVQSAFCCDRSLTWAVGERCLLFLVKPPGSAVASVLRGGSGKLELPVSGFLSLDDVRRFRDRGRFDPRDLALFVKKAGPAALSYATWHAGPTLHEADLARAPLVQAALLEEFCKLVRTNAASDAMVHALDQLTEESFDAALDDVHELLSRAPQWFSSRVNSRFELLRVVRHAIRRGERWAFPVVLDMLEITEAEIARRTVTEPASEFRLELIRLLSAIDPDRARSLAWDIYSAASEKGPRSRFDVMGLLLQIDPERAADRLFSECERRLLSGEAIWIHWLFHLQDDRARALRAKILAEVVPLGARLPTWHWHLARELLPDHAAEAARHGSAFVEQALACPIEGDFPDRFLDWLRLASLAEGAEKEKLVRGVRPRFAAFLGRDLSPESLMALCRAAETVLETKVLPDGIPTKKQLGSARQTLVEALRN